MRSDDAPRRERVCPLMALMVSPRPLACGGQGDEDVLGAELFGCGPAGVRMSASLSTRAVTASRSPSRAWRSSSVGSTCSSEAVHREPPVRRSPQSPSATTRVGQRDTGVWNRRDVTLASRRSSLRGEQIHQTMDGQMEFTTRAPTNGIGRRSTSRTANKPVT
jgi:hypothetical protein